MTPFTDRHIGPRAADRDAMLTAIGLSSLDELTQRAVPTSIRLPSTTSLALPPAATEHDVAALVRALGALNKPLRSMLGQGYYGTITPAVIRRNVVENPAWYTAYTPYQPEISQGRLEALLNFQTMVAELTGMDLAQASMLDEATAAAEAMTLARRQAKQPADRFLVDADCHPRVIEVVQTRAEPLDIEVVVGDPSELIGTGAWFGVLLAYPGSSGTLRDLGPIIDAVHAQQGLACVASDLLACVLLEPPGSFGADVVVGSAQRFGVPMGYGGPHAGFLATRDEHRRAIPGRLVGVSVDAHGRPAMRLALQTREQHIRREKATSNICTAQVLLAVVAGMYAAYHGPAGLTDIAQEVHRRTANIAAGSITAGWAVVNGDAFFDTITLRKTAAARIAVDAALAAGINLRFVDADTLALSCDETTTDGDVALVLRALGASPDAAAAAPAPAGVVSRIPDRLRRRAPVLSHPVFSRYHSETEMLRYLRRLSDVDLALDRSMIPLGSCTMKLNATTEMEPITTPAWADIHPFAPADQAGGYRVLIEELENWLAECTGYDAVSVEPNAGSQGELAGLLAIRAFHQARGGADARRDVCLIPSSAHGTNAASAVMAGMRVVVVACDDDGNIDLIDLDKKIAEHQQSLSALMVTYPSTHGVFEVAITRICELVHEAGGQVYLDGANFNALVGVAKPGWFGADVSHLNLHKTFCIPHGGGGPGVGPVCVKAHLAPYLPGRGVVGAVSMAPFGSAGILPIPWTYIRMMGADGLRSATQHAILAANYVSRRLEAHYPVLYKGDGGFVAHECILDLRAITRTTGVTGEDVAKRLIDYGFHAPTMSFPVAGTLMVEPTESESLDELDRFCEAMIAIKAEIDRVGAGEWPRDDNPLANAPHPPQDVASDSWTHPYSRDLAAFPLASLRRSKYWSPVSRIDNAYGDRNVMCACPPIEAFA